MVTYLITLAGRGHHPLNMHLEVWCAKIEPKLKKNKIHQKTHHFLTFFHHFSGFSKFFQF